jgi:hypothetical protein
MCTPYLRALIIFAMAFGATTLIGCGAGKNPIMGPDLGSSSKTTLSDDQQDQERDTLARTYPGLKGYDLDNLIDAEDEEDNTGNQGTLRTIKPARGGDEDIGLESREDIARMYPGLKDYDLDNLIDDPEDN